MSAVITPLNTRARQVLCRVVPAAARDMRPDGVATVSLARLPVLVDALDRAGYTIRIEDEERR